MAVTAQFNTDIFMAFEDIRTNLPLIDVAHDNRHVLAAGAHSREGVVYMLSLPDEGIGGFIYPWINADGTASAATCMFGPGVGDPIQERFEAQPVSAEMDFYDWKVEGLTLRIDEPLVSAEVSFKGKRVNIDYRFDAFHPPYAFSSHKDGCPRYYADDRTEQHGHIRGVLEIDGRSIPFDTVGQRDHAWGNRVWGLNQHYKWFHATTRTSAVHIRGFVCKDQVMSQIVSVEHEYIFDDTMHHLAINVIARDELGRSTSIKCKTFAKFQFDPDPMVLLNESATIVEIDGVKGVGWCEFCWNRGYLEFARQHVQSFQPYRFSS